MYKKYPALCSLPEWTNDTRHMSQPWLSLNQHMLIPPKQQFAEAIERNVSFKEFYAKNQEIKIQSLLSKLTVTLPPNNKENETTWIIQSSTSYSHQYFTSEHVLERQLNKQRKPARKHTTCHDTSKMKRTKIKGMRMYTMHANELSAFAALNKVHTDLRCVWNLIEDRADSELQTEPQGLESLLQDMWPQKKHGGN